MWLFSKTISSKYCNCGMILVIIMGSHRYRLCVTVWAWKICWATCFHIYSPDISLQKDKFSQNGFGKIIWTLSISWVMCQSSIRVVANMSEFKAINKFHLLNIWTYELFIHWTGRFKGNQGFLKESESEGRISWNVVLVF